MKKMLILLLFVSCGGGLSDYTENLGGNYKYVVEGVGNNFILGKKTIDAEIICYAYNQRYILALQYPDYDFILNRLGEDLYQKYYLYSKLFISREIKRDKMDSSLYNELQTGYAKRIYEYFKSRHVPLDNGSKTIKYRKSLADSIISNNTYYKKLFKRQLNYWIIDKKTNQLFGPYNQKSYLEKKESLNINLELKSTVVYPERVREIYIQ